MDYWALGITLYQILFGEHPIKDARKINNTDLCNKILQLDILGQLKPYIEESIALTDNAEELFYLVCQCVQLLQYNGDNRLIIESTDIVDLRTINESISVLIRQNSERLGEDAIVELNQLKEETLISVIQELIQDTIIRLEYTPHVKGQLDQLSLLRYSINLCIVGYGKGTYK
jgi:serine/threonine protein kinase